MNSQVVSRKPYIAALLCAILAFPPCVTLAQQSASNGAGASSLPPAPISLNAAQEPLISSPQLPTGPWTRQTHAIARCAVPPTIDGKLSDACWKTATHIQGFYRLTSNAPIPEQTEAWLCADATHLYIAFHCLDSHPELIRRNETQRNGNVTRDDYVALDIDSQNTHRNASTFLVTARGTQWETLEGGTADNITWAGDWRGAAARTNDGWSCEIAIPFALLRYPHGANQFGILLYRKVARETTLTGWPYIPPQALSGDNTVEAPFMDEFSGIAPPFYAPKPVFLPYALASAGATNTSRQGMDIKYPLTTTLTGVGTIRPDFKDIEQDITTINFSYTPKLLTDHRPFFAEGSGYLPSQALFYSRAIGDIDGGLKVVGKTGATTLGVLATTLEGQNWQNANVINMAHDVGLRSNYGFSMVGDQQQGLPSNQVGSIYGLYGFESGSSVLRFSAQHDQSWLGGAKQDGFDSFTLTSTPTNGRVSLAATYNDIGPNFISNLGFVPDVNTRGVTTQVNMFNQFDKGKVENYYWEWDESSFQHHTSGFFQNTNSLYGQVALRAGVQLDQYYQISQREQFHDRLEFTRLHWNTKSLYQQGNAEQDIGHLEGMPYNFLSLNQGFLISRPFSLQASYNRAKLGSTLMRQFVATGTYRISNERTVGGRIVVQDGRTNLFFSFSQQARAGNDIFVIFGDPNSDATRSIVTLKIVHPMSL